MMTDPKGSSETLLLGERNLASKGMFTPVMGYAMTPKKWFVLGANKQSEHR